MTFLVITTAVATAIVAVVAALSTKPVRWLFKRLFAAPLTDWTVGVVLGVVKSDEMKSWVKDAATEALDESINGGVVHLNRRMTRLEETVGIEPMPHQFEGRDP